MCVLYVYIYIYIICIYIYIMYICSTCFSIYDLKYQLYRVIPKYGPPENAETFSKHHPIPRQRFLSLRSETDPQRFDAGVQRKNTK